ncbi:MPN385 family protein [Mycoplasmoides alvi]|uniref:MPN385 family protein n=1 Tax=Mycoplasmoides alvi TaxID=78580 RepID=UPI000699055E|nr:hypothetical protein [Mycoplasmoides alvi]
MVKFFKFLVFLVIVTCLCIIFIGSFWLPNIYDLNSWSNWFASKAQPSGVLTLMFNNVGNWYFNTLNMYSNFGDSDSLQNFLSYIIPIGFGIVFGLIGYFLVFLFGWIIWHK